MFQTRGFIFRKMAVYAVMVWYGMVCFTCISISSLVGRRVCAIFLPTTILILMYEKGKGKGKGKCKVHCRTGHEDPEGSRVIALLFL